MSRAYTKETRLAYVKTNLPRIEKDGLTHRQIALEIQAQFGLSKPPSPATIMRTLADARQGDMGDYSEEAQALLDPEAFPEWRKLFTAPDGDPYETPIHQHALFWVIYCLTEKEDLPAWVIEYYDLPEDINATVTLKQALLTFVLLYAPRHGKSMLVVHAMIWLLCRNPDVRILYCQGVLKTSVKVLKLVMAELTFNKRLLEMYGPFRADDRQWNNDGFVVARRKIESITPTLTPIGVQTNIRSLDGDIIIVDDPQDKDRAESETTTRRDYEWLTTELMTRREAHTPVFMVGSHVPTLFGDIFTQLEDNLDDLTTEEQIVLIRKVPAHDDTKCLGGDTDHKDCLLWPEKRSIHFLQAQEAMLGPELFLAVYQQEARVPGARPFEPEVIKGMYLPGVMDAGRMLAPQAEALGIQDTSRSWKEPVTCCGRVYTVVGFDPAAGESKNASMSACVVLAGCINCRRLFIIDYWARRQSPDLHADTIVGFAAAFGAAYVRIEINAYQKALARDAVLREGARQHGFVIDEWFTDDRKNTPEFGIPMLARWMKDGMFSMPAKHEEDRAYGKEIVNALIRYPIKPNDIPMALWLAAGMMWQVWDLYSVQEPVHLNRFRKHVPEYMLEGMRVNLADIGNSPRTGVLGWLSERATRNIQ